MDILYYKMEKDPYKLCFVISHRYYRNYISYIQYYVDNIQKFYTDSLIIIVDNNSLYINDIIGKFKTYNNIVILSNTTQCKFELGAYKVGINFLLEQKLLDNYDYIIFSQDNFVLKNKYDFNSMKDNNILAMSFARGQNGNHHYGNHHYDCFHSEPSQKILQRLNLLESINIFSVCWCNSFILHTSKILEFLDITQDIIITIRRESECSERYLDAIIFYLNNNKNYTMNYIEGGCLSYNCWNINLLEDNVIEYFAKRIQHKTETTEDC